MAHSIRFPRRHDKADRNGRYAVRLCITKNKRRKYIALDLYADPAYWDEAGEQFIILRNLKGAEQKGQLKAAALKAVPRLQQLRGKELMTAFLQSAPPNARAAVRPKNPLYYSIGAVSLQGLILKCLLNMQAVPHEKTRVPSARLPCLLRGGML